MISFFPTPNAEEKDFCDKAKKFSDAFIRPTAVADDATENFRRSIFEGLAKLGLTSVHIPPEWGGQGKTHTTYYAVLEELAKASAAFSITVGVNQLVQGALLQFGSAEQKTEFLPLLTSGQMLGAFSLSESGSGSDASSLRLAAKLAPGGYLLSGTKMWCTNGGLADLYLVMGRTGGDGAKGISSFLVRKDSPGFRIGKKEQKLGLKPSSLTELVFEECFIPEQYRLAKEGEGFKVALSQLDAGRIGIAATAIGLSVEALNRVWEEGLVQKSFVFSEGTKAQFAEDFAALQAVKALLNLTTQLKDRGDAVTALASQCKLLATDLAMRITSNSVEVLGFQGSSPAFGMERLMRDAKALQIVEGTNQIQKLVLSRELEKMVTS